MRKIVTQATKKFPRGKKYMNESDQLKQLIKSVGIFKRLRPKTQAQAARFFYCKLMIPGSVSFLSGKACAERHKQHKLKMEKLRAEESSPIDYKIAGCEACGTCEFGALRAELLKKRRKKNE